MSLKNKVVAVTGGAGFIGSHLVDRLIEENPEKIIIVDNFFLGKHRNIDKSIKMSDKIKLYCRDCSNYEKMHNIFNIETIDVVFNLAVIPLLTSHELPKVTCEENINITLNMLELQRNGCYKTLIHCSSSEAYGSAEKIPMDENHPLNPTTPYAASKAASDLLVLSYQNTFAIDTTIIRPFNNYGPRQNEGSYAGVIPITIKRILDGKKPIIYGDGKQTRDYIFVKDTVEGFIKAYNDNNTRGKIINIASGKEITISDLISLISDEMDYDGRIEFGEARKADLRRHRGDISLAKNLMDFEPQTSFEEGIKSTVKWYKKFFLEP